MIEDIRLSLVVDMCGCPNRCKHCWLGHMPNTKMKDDIDEWIINYFKPYFKHIAYYSWLREPDFIENYRERWIKDKKLSVESTPMRFELASFYRLVRDPEYVEFLKEVGTKIVQLTFFGLEQLSDKYIGRKGAFNELLEASEILIENGIAPRWQCFINEENKNEIIDVLKLSEKLKLSERCREFGEEFKFFVHPGSCDGENYKLYDIRLNKMNIPNELRPYMLDIDEYYSESELVEMLKNDESIVDFDYGNDLVLNISNNLDVYYNFTHMKKSWCIGNLENEEPEDLIRKVINYDVDAINKAKNISIAELVKQFGNATSDRMFAIDDYKMYLLLKYLSD
ncbi:MAG: radical SAM protein [Erysipelotrichales bacterium]|nr:radical SAM protein [Erysipelotrichales bacterium]